MQTSRKHEIEDSAGVFLLSSTNINDLKSSETEKFMDAVMEERSIEGSRQEKQVCPSQHIDADFVNLLQSRASKQIKYFWNRSRNMLQLRVGNSPKKFIFVTAAALTMPPSSTEHCDPSTCACLEDIHR